MDGVDVFDFVSVVIFEFFRYNVVFVRVFVSVLVYFGVIVVNMVDVRLLGLRVVVGMFWWRLGK